jgi:hypothetical protein
MLFDDNRMLFFDARDIEAMENTARVMNPPTKRGPCLVIEKEWELGGVRPLCVVEWQGTWRFYYKVSLVTPDASGYSGLTVSENPVASGYSGLTVSENPVASGCSGLTVSDHACLAMAVSADGENWERPELGVVEFNGSKANNLVSPDGRDANEGCIFVDPTAPDEHRFKMVGHSQEEGGMFVLTSPDGLRFTRHPENLLTFILDNHNTSFYDARIGKYVIYSRGWDRDRPIPPMEGSRTVIRIETDDLFAPVPFDENAPDPWPPSKKQEGLGHHGMRRVNKELPSVISPDDLDPPEADIYQAAAVQYLPDAYLAFPSLYYHHPWYPEGFINDGYLDLQFASSRDGVEWRRDFRGSYVRLDLPDGPCTKMMHMLVGTIPHGDRLSQYYVGGRRSHGEGRTPDARPERQPPKIGDPIAFRLEQRIDGFVSADSGYTGGTLVTRPFLLESPNLRLNIDTSASGVAHAALLDEDGAEIPGFGVEDSDRIQGNDTQYVLTWRKESDLSTLRGKKVRLLLQSRSTKLFAIYP